MIMSFINRTLFIRYLGTSYLGISGLFSDILSMLSLAELGIGTAIVFSLYEPLAIGDKQKIKALMNFYKKSYQIIGIFVFIAGLCLIPLLDVLIKDKPKIDNFTLIYLLYLTNSAVSYLFTYKRSILLSDQKEYVNTINNTIFIIIQNILQFVVLILIKDFIAYLVVTILCTIISNISISIQSDKKYPYLKDNKEKLNNNEKKNLLKYVFAQMSHKVGGVVVSGTDSLLISVLLDKGIILMGLYSNYALIINSVRKIINIFFSATTASVGNLNVTTKKEHAKEIFNNMFFVSACFYGVTASCIMNLSDDFVRLWLGQDYLLNFSVVIIITLNYFITGMRQSCIIYNTTLGLFWNDRFKPWVEAIINLATSILFVKYFGLAGIFLGTLTSTLTTSFWVEPYILYKHKFNQTIKDYFQRYGKYSLVVMTSTLISYFMWRGIEIDDWILWLIKATTVFLCSSIIFSVTFRKSPEFEYMINVLRVSRIIEGGSNEIEKK